MLVYEDVSVPDHRMVVLVVNFGSTSFTTPYSGQLVIELVNGQFKDIINLT